MGAAMAVDVVSRELKSLQDEQVRRRQRRLRHALVNPAMFNEGILPARPPSCHNRPVRYGLTRATLIASIARGRCWLSELVDDAKGERRKHC